MALRFLSLCRFNVLQPLRRSLTSITVNEDPQHTVEEVVENLGVMLEAEPWHASVKKSKAHLSQFLPALQDELPSRSMRDSYDSAWIPIGRNPVLRDKYLTFTGGVRSGRVLEDMDVFAVWLCYKHILNPKQKEGRSAYSVVTALVDQIHFSKNELKADQDFKLSGHVSWAGRSSLEVTISLSQLDESRRWNSVIEALFVMVARDVATKKAAIVNALQPEGEEEAKLFRRGEENKLARLKWQKNNIFDTPPKPDEQVFIHQLFGKMRDPHSGSFVPSVRIENSTWMCDAKLKNMVLCHPEVRNRAHKVFGGFIMRKALELAWALTFVHSKQRPVLRHIDDVLFRKPVEIGSLLYLASQVVYVNGHDLMVRVTADVVDPATGKHDLTNAFNLLYRVENPIPEVLPQTYHESLLYLDGRRRYQLIQRSSNRKDTAASQ